MSKSKSAVSQRRAAKHAHKNRANAKKAAVTKAEKSRHKRATNKLMPGTLLTRAEWAAMCSDEPHPCMGLGSSMMRAERRAQPSAPTKPKKPRRERADFVGWDGTRYTRAEIDAPASDKPFPPMGPGSALIRFAWRPPTYQGPPMTIEQVLDLLRNPTDDVVTDITEAGYRTLGSSTCWSKDATVALLRQLAEIIRTNRNGY